MTAPALSGEGLRRFLLTASSGHKLLGEYWESIGGTWGGRFNDGNHYSLEHNGVK